MLHDLAFYNNSNGLNNTLRYACCYILKIAIKLDYSFTAFTHKSIQINTTYLQQKKYIY